MERRHDKRAGSIFFRNFSPPRAIRGAVRAANPNLGLRPSAVRARPASQLGRFVSPGEEPSGLHLRAEAKTELSKSFDTPEQAEARKARWAHFSGARGSFKARAPQGDRAEAGSSEQQRPQGGFSPPELKAGESQAQYFNRFAAALSDWATEHRSQLGLDPQRAAASAQGKPQRARPGLGRRRSFSLFDPLAAG